jgi:hypothetical protein
MEIEVSCLISEGRAHEANRSAYTASSMVLLQRAHGCLHTATLPHCSALLLYVVTETATLYLMIVRCPVMLSAALCAAVLSVHLRRPALACAIKLMLQLYVEDSASKCCSLSS